jgi:hypothetical protein
MNKLLLALLAIPTLATATGNHLQPTGSDNYNSLIQGQHQSINNAVEVQGASVGGISNASVGGNVDIDQEKPAANSAISPSVGTNNDCQIATPSSKAFSILIMSVSGTTGMTYNDICYAYKRGQFDVADKLMCLKSADYAKANPNCKGEK